MGMIGSALAYFSDVATSTGNTFTAGMLGLQIMDDGAWNPETWTDTVHRTWEMTNMVPGESEVTNWCMLRETGNVFGNHIEIAFSDNVEPSPPLAPQDMARWLQITAWMYDDVNMVRAITHTTGWDVNSNGILDLDDVVRSTAINAPGGPLDNLTPPHAYTYSNTHMTVAFNGGAGNTCQGATFTLVVTFTLMQSSSQ